MSDQEKKVDAGKGLKEGVKNDSEKLRYDLIPPWVLYELARVYTIGAKKYNDNNWRKGMSFMRIFRALMNHALKWLCGYKYDSDDGQHHLASVIWNATTLMYYERKAELDPAFAEKFDNRLDLDSIPNQDTKAITPAKIIGEENGTKS